MNGVSIKRRLLYAGVVVLLLAANVLRWLWAEPLGEASSVAGIAEPVAAIPELVVARELVATPPSATRDLFRRPPDDAAPSIAAATPPPVTRTAPVVDPLKVAKDAATRQFDAMQLLGVMRAGEDLQIMLQYEGQMKLLKVGQDVLPGFTIAEITNDTARIAHAELGLIAIVPMADTGETLIIGMDG
jgi:hypothetical protein